MRLLMRSVCHGLLLILSVSYAAASGKDKAEEQGRPLLQAAADWLLRPDFSPLKLKLTFEIRGPLSKHMQGTYVWLRNGKDWRREILFSDYADYVDVKVGHDTVLWSKRNLDFKPLQAVWVEAVIDNYLSNAADSIERYFTTSDHHVQLQCVDLLRNRQPRTFCFDSQGNLLKAEVKSWT